MSLLLVVGLLGYIMWLLGDWYVAGFVLTGVVVLLAQVAAYLALIWAVVSLLARVLPGRWKTPFQERRRQTVLVAATSLFILYRVGMLANMAWLPSRYSLLSLMGNAVLLVGTGLLVKVLLKLRPDRVLPYAAIAVATVVLTSGLRARASGTPAVAPGGQQTAQTAQALATLPYIAFVPESEQAVSPGIGYVDTVRSFQGFNLCASLVAPRAFLLDMKGNVVHEWNKDIDPGYPWEFVRLCRNGDLLVSIQDRKLARLDWNSRIKWMRKLRCHHDMTEAPNGDILVLQRSYGFTTVHDLPTPSRDDHVVVLSAAGEVKDEFSIGHSLRDAVPVSWALRIWRWQLTNVRTSIQRRMQNSFMFDKGYMDLLHTNTVTAVDRN
ncbi:MAG TPA: aryl-sulfate sulfotransferase, partial [Candidatus Krumholzibacteria bacterium]